MSDNSEPRKDTPMRDMMLADYLRATSSIHGFVPEMLVNAVKLFDDIYPPTAKRAESLTQMVYG